MGFSKLKTGNGNTVPPKTTATETEVKTAEVATVVANTGSTLAVFGGGVDASAALNAITELANSGTPVVFPTLNVKGGNAGGSMEPAKFVAQEVADQLPQGKKPVDGVFMGYRSALNAWPVGYNDRTEGDKPVFSVAISCGDAEGAGLMGVAAKSYQYTKGDLKGKWDAADSGIGHLLPSMEIMMYVPAVDDIVIITTPAKFTSWTGTNANLNKLVDPKTKQLLQQPVQVRVVSTPKTVNGNPITEHVLDFNVVATETGKEWYQKYAQFIQQAAADEELREKIENWVNGADRPLTDAIRAVLTKASTFKA
jgi:hypothetical protein